MMLGQKSEQSPTGEALRSEQSVPMHAVDTASSRSTGNTHGRVFSNTGKPTVSRGGITSASAGVYNQGRAARPAYLPSNKGDYKMKMPWSVVYLRNGVRKQVAYAYEDAARLAVEKHNRIWAGTVCWAYYGRRVA